MRLTQQVLLELAREGDVVIRGRGSQFLLRGAPRTLHISIFAPLDVRIEQVMNLYHLLMNTGLFPHASATHFIQQALPLVKKLDH